MSDAAPRRGSRARPYERRAARRRRGSTLPDVLCAASLVGIFASVAGGAARYMGQATSALRVRARVATELRMAAEFLRQDLGGAASVAESDGGVWITRTEPVAKLQGGWVTGADAGIEYVEVDGRLVRRDLADGTEIVVARGVAELVVAEPASDSTSVSITIGAGSEGRTVTLMWRQP